MVVFLTEDDNLLEKYNAVVKKDFDSEAVYNNVFLKTKIKSNGDEARDFYDKKNS